MSKNKAKQGEEIKSIFVNDSISTGIVCENEGSSATLDKKTLEELSESLGSLVEEMTSTTPYQTKAFHADLSDVIPSINKKASYELSIVNDFGYSKKSLKAKNEDDLELMFNLKLINGEGELSLSSPFRICLMRNSNNSNPNYQISTTGNSSFILTGNNIESVAIDSVKNKKKRLLIPFLIPFLIVKSIARIKVPDFDFSKSVKKRISKGKITVSSLQLASYIPIKNNLHESFLEFVRYAYNLSVFDGSRSIRLRDYLGIEEDHKILDYMYLLVPPKKSREYFASSAMLKAKDGSGKVSLFTVNFYSKILWLYYRQEHEFIPKEVLGKYKYLEDYLRVDCQLHLPAILHLLKSAGVDNSAAGDCDRRKDRKSPFVKDVIKAMLRLDKHLETEKQYDLEGLGNWMQKECFEYYTGLNSVMYFSKLGVEGEDPRILHKRYKKLRKVFENEGSEQQVIGLEAIFSYQPVLHEKYDASKVIRDAIRVQYGSNYTKAPKLIEKINKAGIPTAAPIVFYERIIHDAKLWGMSVKDRNKFDRLGNRIEESFKELTIIQQEIKPDQKMISKLSETMRCSIEEQNKIGKKSKRKVGLLRGALGSLSSGDALIPPRSQSIEFSDKKDSIRS